mgnify:CR=1 FL=1
MRDITGKTADKAAKAVANAVNWVSRNAMSLLLDNIVHLINSTWYVSFTQKYTPWEKW